MRITYAHDVCQNACTLIRYVFVYTYMNLYRYIFICMYIQNTCMYLDKDVSIHDTVSLVVLCIFLMLVRAFGLMMSTNRAVRNWGHYQSETWMLQKVWSEVKAAEARCSVIGFALKSQPMQTAKCRVSNTLPMLLTPTLMPCMPSTLVPLKLLSPDHPVSGLSHTLAKLPPMIIWCRPSKHGVEKSS